MAIAVDNVTTIVEQDTLKSWFRLIVLFIIGVIGTVGMWSVVVVLPALETEFNIDRGNASLLYATTMVGFGLGNFLIGKITDKIGIKIPIVIAIITLILSYLLATISKEFWQLLILQVFMGLAAATFFGPSMADIGNFFETRRGLAVSIIASANYVAGASWPLVISYFLNFSDWRDVYLYIALICLIIMVPLVLILKNNIASHSDTSLNSNFQNHKFNNLSSRKLQNLLMLAGVGCCVAMAMPQVHIVALCVDSGFGLNVGAEVLSVMLFSGMISRVAFGFLSDKIGPIFTLFIGSLLQMLALVFFIPFDSQFSLYIVSLMFGLSQGGIVPAYAMIVRKYLPLSEVGERVGLVIMATIVGMGLGGWMSGEIYDLTQSYKLAFVNGILWNLTNVIIVTFIMWKIVFQKKIKTN
jgi:MFS family permease|tara:strand:+ start:3627 stop:4862 length:1236 start_codon:yes stop_codon:yes gene_type:complete